MTWIVAHQGGWDEALLFVGPLVVAFLIIGAIERRGRRRQRELMMSTEPTGVDVEDAADPGLDRHESGSQNGTP